MYQRPSRNASRNKALRRAHTRHNSLAKNVDPYHKEWRIAEPTPEPVALTTPGTPTKIADAMMEMFRKTAKSKPGSPD